MTTLTFLVAPRLGDARADGEDGEVALCLQRGRELGDGHVHRGLGDPVLDVHVDPRACHQSGLCGERRDRDDLLRRPGADEREERVDRVDYSDDVGLELRDSSQLSVAKERTMTGGDTMLTKSSSRTFSSGLCSE